MKPSKISGRPYDKRAVGRSCSTVKGGKIQKCEVFEVAWPAAGAAAVAVWYRGPDFGDFFCKIFTKIFVLHTPPPNIQYEEGGPQGRLLFIVRLRPDVASGWFRWSALAWPNFRLRLDVVSGWFRWSALA